MSVPAATYRSQWLGHAARPFAAFMASCVTTFLVSFGLIWIYVAACPMAFLDRDYPLWRAKQALLDQCLPDTVAVFGDSRTVAGIMPRAMPLPVTNFAQSGTSPVETYFAVRRALRCANPPKLVVIAHGALKFTDDSDYWRFARNGFFSYADMRDVAHDAARLHDTGIAQLAGGDHLPSWLRDGLYALRFPTFYFSSLVHGYVAGRWRHNTAAEQDGLRASGHALFGTDPGFSGVASEADAGDFVPSPLVDLYYRRTLALLHEHHVPVLLLTMPINQATYRRTPPRLRDPFAAYLRGRAERFDNVVLSGPAIPCWADAFYGDAWHFNAAGAQAFSQELGGFLTHLLAGGAATPRPDHCPAAS